jgi:hypothetical protein
MGLNPIEVRIIEFSVMVKANHQLKMGAESLGNLDKSQLTQALSTVLDLPVPDIREALHPQARLAQSGLLSISKSPTVTAITVPEPGTWMASIFSVIAILLLKLTKEKARNNFRFLGD